MAIKQISINSEAASSVMTYVANSCAILQSDVKGKLSTSFEPLISLGFLEGAVSKVEKQVDTLISAHNSIVSEISSHMQDVQSQEDGLAAGYGSGRYTGGYQGYNNADNTVSEDFVEPTDTGITDASEFEVVQETDGLKVSTSELLEMFDTIEGEYQNTLVDLINTNKPTGASLISLFLDNSNSEALYKTIKKIFGESLDINDFTLEDYEYVQRYLLNMIIKSETEFPKLTEDTILAGRPYLVKVCEDNNIEPCELLLDDKYKDLLKQTLLNIYDGNVDNTMTEIQLDNYRDAVDLIAFNNKTTSEEIIMNNPELLFRGEKYGSKS